jgi:hypothetical protein
MFSPEFPDCTGIRITGFRFTEGPMYLHLIHMVSAVVYLLCKEMGKPINSSHLSVFC